jgi:hypothetical protein
MSERVFISVEGMSVEGEVTHRSPRDIAVLILSPYRGLTAGRHVAAFVPLPPERDFCGPHGDEIIVELLEGLYRLGRFVEGHGESLRAKAAELDVATERLDPERFLTESSFRQVRRDLRARLRDGSLDGRTYQERLGKARKKVKARQQEIHRLQEGFFGSCFPMVVPVGTREEVLAVLRTSR